MSHWMSFPSTSVVKSLPAMQETLVQYLGQEDPLEKVWAAHSSILEPLNGGTSLEPGNVREMDSPWEHGQEDTYLDSVYRTVR